MRANILIIYLIFSSLLVNAQSKKYFDPKPKDMEFVPQGSFKMQIDSSIKTISVDAFWMSNEITNKEYREFTDYAIQHPTDSLLWIDFDKTTNSANIKEHTRSCTYQQLYSDLIDSLSISKDYPINSDRYNKYKKYFTDKSFDNYPVVGVSQKGARFYCIWRTKMENLAMEKKNKPYIQEYRLPLELEWCYVADYCKDSEIKASNEIQVSKYGKANNLGLFNVFGNVSEWTASKDSQKGIVKGSSWKDTKIENPRLVVDIDTKASYIGFRIVRSYSGNKK